MRALSGAVRVTTHTRAIAGYLTALVLCLLVVAAAFDVSPGARRWPYVYGGDTMFYHLIAKSVANHGWFLDVPLLGAPETLNLRDVPASDNNLHVLLLWVLTRGTSNYALALNNFFLLSFPLVLLCALGVLRHFGVTWPTSVAVSLLYAFAPYHLPVAPPPLAAFAGAGASTAGGATGQ